MKCSLDLTFPLALFLGKAKNRLHSKDSEENRGPDCNAQTQQTVLLTSCGP